MQTKLEPRSHFLKINIATDINKNVQIDKNLLSEIGPRQMIVRDQLPEVVL